MLFGVALYDESRAIYNNINDFYPKFFTVSSEYLTVLIASGA